MLRHIRNARTLLVAAALFVGACAPVNRADKKEERPTGAEVANEASAAAKKAETDKVTLYSSSIDEDGEAAAEPDQSKSDSDQMTEPPKTLDTDAADQPDTGQPDEKQVGDEADQKAGDEKADDTGGEKTGDEKAGDEKGEPAAPTKKQ